MTREYFIFKEPGFLELYDVKYRDWDPAEKAYSDYNYIGAAFFLWGARLRRWWHIKRGKEKPPFMEYKEVEI